MTTVCLPLQIMSETDPDIDYFKRLDSISHNWFQFIEDFSDKPLKQYFDLLCQTIEENNTLLSTIEDNQNQQLKDIIVNSELNVSGKSAEEVNERDLLNESSVLSSNIESMSCELLTKKQLKSELSDKTKALSKQLEQMESTTKQLKRQKESKNNEYKTLASVMRVMYKTWNNSQVVGLLFKDNEEKSLDRLIVIDKENKTEEEMSEQFWQSLNKEYVTD